MQQRLPTTEPTAEISRAIFWMRNWVYVNLGFLLLMIALIVFVQGAALLICGVPALFFGWGIAICHTVELRLRRGSSAFVPAARFTCNMAILLTAISAFPVAVLASILALAQEWLASAMGGAIFFLLLIFIQLTARTERILVRAAWAIAANGPTFGFPVELAPPRE